MIARALQKFADWALANNAAGSYQGENDDRWAYTIATNGSPYLTRVLLSRLLKLRDRLGVGVYLHKFHRPDVDKHLHSHPWKWACSIILAGSYDEERLDQVIDVGRVDEPDHIILTDKRRVRFFNFLTDRDYHAVTQLHGDVWTLFITGPRVLDDAWGFLVDGVHVPWRKYLGKE